MAFENTRKATGTFPSHLNVEAAKVHRICDLVERLYIPVKKDLGEDVPEGEVRSHVLALALKLVPVALLAFLTLAALAAPSAAFASGGGGGEFDLVAAIFGAVPPLVLLIVTILKLYPWGKRNEKALDEVVEAVGRARKLEQPARKILEIMKARERTAEPEVVAAWKRAVQRRDPGKSKLKNGGR